MDQNILFAIIGVAGIILGIIAGKLLFSKNTKKQVAEAEILAQSILKEAELRGETFKKEKELEAKERFVQMRSNHEKEVFEKNKRSMMRRIVFVKKSNPLTRKKEILISI